MGFKQRNKKKDSKNDVRHSHQRIHNRNEHNHQMKKLNQARKYFAVQKILGRPFKKYNLLYSLDEGDWFSSEDDLSEGFIYGVLARLERENPVNCGAWKIMYQSKTHSMKDDRQFFMYANLSENPANRDIIDKYEYFTWTEEASS